MTFQITIRTIHIKNLMVDKRELMKMHDMKMYYIQILFTRVEGNLCFNFHYILGTNS